MAKNLLLSESKKAETFRLDSVIVDDGICPKSNELGFPSIRRGPSPVKVLSTDQNPLESVEDEQADPRIDPSLNSRERLGLFKDPRRVRKAQHGQSGANDGQDHPQKA